MAKKIQIIDVRCANPNGCNRLLGKIGKGSYIEVECKRCFGRTIYDDSTGEKKFLSRDDKSK